MTHQFTVTSTTAESPHPEFDWHVVCGCGGLSGFAMLEGIGTLIAAHLLNVPSKGVEPITSPS